MYHYKTKGRVKVLVKDTNNELIPLTFGIL